MFRLFLGAALAVTTWSSIACGEDVGADLPPGAGRDHLRNNCQACHSLSYITKTRKSRSGWDKTITSMQKKNGMWQVDDKTRADLTDYLAAQFGPSTGSGKGDDEYSLLRPRVNPLPPSRP